MAYQWTYLTLRITWEAVQGPAMRAAADAAGIALDVSLLELPTSEAAYGEAIAKARARVQMSS